MWYNLPMISKENLQEQLNQMSREQLVDSYIQMAEKQEKLEKQLINLQQSVAMLNQQRFGRKTEKVLPTQNQLSFDSLDLEIFNEAEAFARDRTAEPEYEEVVIKRKKRKGKREDDIKNVELVVDPTITLPEDKLIELFPNGYKMLPDEVYKTLEHIPEQFIAHEHHYAVYASKDGTKVVRASATLKPERLLQNSLLTPSLMAGILNAKYVNHMPLNRISTDYKSKDINISKQVMAGWCIKIPDRYLRDLYAAMKKQLLSNRLIHCDETPFTVINNGRASGTKDWMWVYHTPERDGLPGIYIYDYQPTRKTSAPEDFLEGYNGVLMTDGYEVYHSLERKHPESYVVAGCWSHLRRIFAEYIKGLGKCAAGTVADEAVKKIAAIYHTDKLCKDSPPEIMLENRQKNVKPLVDAYFEWIKSIAGTMDKGSKTYAGVRYSINQEQFLRRFLENPIIPLDNNDAERSIRSFCIGKHSWHVIDNKNGAEASAMLYSIAETAKANNLKTYEYFKYVLEQVLLHFCDKPETYIHELSPWSKTLPDSCRLLSFDPIPNPETI